jgi:hypothetical protein
MVMVLRREGSMTARPERPPSSVEVDSRIAIRERHMNLMEADSMIATTWLEREAVVVVVAAAAAVEAEVQLHMTWQPDPRSCIC